MHCHSVLHRLKSHYYSTSHKFISFLACFQNLPGSKSPILGTRLNLEFSTFGAGKEAHCTDSAATNLGISWFKADEGGEPAIAVQNLLNDCRFRSIRETERLLDACGLTFTEDFILDVLRRHTSDWKPAYAFFNWVSKRSGYALGSVIYNEILDVLGKSHRFGEVAQVLDEMSKRKGLYDEGTYGVLVKRFAAAHKVDEAVDVFNRRPEYGLETDLAAFRTLLMWLCRYKHVDEAETLFYSDKNEFGRRDIKTMNIILNGWCVLGDVREAKRFWKDIIASKCIPDKFTCGTFINALTKKGKLGSALKLFRALLEKGINLDVVICNCMIDALCFKKRIPEALEVFREMNERGAALGCPPNAATYNSLIKHFCKIRRMEKVYELVEEMESRDETCLPNELTYSYLLKSLKKAEEVPELLKRMKSNGCEMTGDLYNLVLKLYMGWNHKDGVAHTWSEMERNGFRPDRRSYTMMIHGLYDRGRTADALFYYNEMISRGMLPEPRTEILVNAMNIDEGKRRHTC